MSERGVFAIDRGLFGHPAFKSQTFTQREAWIWLIAEAAFRGHDRRIGSITLHLARGQVAASLRYMAERWGWSEPTVRRFLNRLKELRMIDAATDAGITIITISNYSKYQRVSLPKDAAHDAARDAKPTQARRKKEDNEVTEYQEISEAKASDDVHLVDPSSEERDYFRRGRQILGDQAGGLIARLLKSKGGNVPKARAALETASQKQNPREYIAAVAKGAGGHTGRAQLNGLSAILFESYLERKNSNE